MNNMLCHITDGPQYDDTQVAVPDAPTGRTLYDMLPNGLADELMSDEVEELHHESNRTHLAEMCRIESQYGERGMGDYLEAGDRLCKIIAEMKRSIGESEYARRWWQDNVWVEGDES